MLDVRIEDPEFISTRLGTARPPWAGRMSHRYGTDLDLRGRSEQADSGTRTGDSGSVPLGRGTMQNCPVIEVTPRTRHGGREETRSPLRSHRDWYPEICPIPVRMCLLLAGRPARPLAACCLIVLLAGTIAAEDNLQSQLSNAQKLIIEGDLSRAADTLRSAIRNSPDDPRAPNLLGVVEAQLGNARSAEQLFRRAIELAPRFGGAYANLGRLYQEQADREPRALEKAIETYRGFLECEPTNPEALYQMAVLHLKRGSHKESLSYLSRLSPQDGQRAMALSVQCANLAALNRTRDAEEVGRRLASHPDLTEFDVTSILGSFDQGPHFHIARDLLESLARRGIASVQVKHRLSLLYESDQKLDLARQSLEDVLRESTQPVNALLDLARIAYKQKDLEGALGYLGRARDLDEDNAGVHFFFGIVCVEMDLVLEARDSLRRAVELEPASPYYAYALGAVAIQDADSSEAIAQFQRYLEMKPDDPHGRSGLGIALYHAADYPAARKQLESAAETAATAPGANYFLGRIELQQFRLTEAIGRFRRAIEASPTYADAYADLGLAYARARDYGQADLALQRAVSLDPEGYRPNMNLLTLYQRTRDERANEQQEKFSRIKEERAAAARLLLRRVEFRPYE